MRRALPQDLPHITAVRTSVIENHLSIEQMAARGITRESLANAMLAGELAGWVVEEDEKVVAFAMASRSEHRIFALFTLPQAEQRGHGTALLAECEAWLKAMGAAEMRLDTGRGTKAHAFYKKRGWVEDVTQSNPLDVELVKAAV